MPENKQKKSISIIIPVLNEEGNILPLMERLDKVLTGADIAYEAIFIDDNSIDRTRAEIRQAAAVWPVFLFGKAGKKGKAYSIIEGMARARYEFIAFIDADLQYPPEAIPAMLDKIDRGYDLVVAHRRQNETGFGRKLMHWGFAFFFTRLLHGFKLDVQAGLKVFRSRIAREAVVSPTPWTFDLEFLLKARSYGYKIGKVDIRFDARANGASKINFFSQIFEIGFNSLRLKLKPIKPLLIPPDGSAGMNGAGIAHKGRRFITHTALARDKSAHSTTVPWQRIFAVLALAAFAFFLAEFPLASGIAFVTVISLYYFADVVFNLFLVARSLNQPPEIGFSRAELSLLAPEELPVYTILCPLYKEAAVLPDFVRSIERLEWPREKLDVLLLLEEDDQETVSAVGETGLPESFRAVVVPHSLPKTKPKACNYGLNLARGEYVVIYDAEDRPDADQLKKAYLGFRRAGAETRCLQAKLNYYNSGQNLLTRLFTAEYSLWFDIILPGLQSINTAIPLGGTSNHFRAEDLRELGGWDPFNVTEDCDLGMRLFARGWRTAIIDSVTLEEANSQVGNWLRQRSRWVKGYMQTYLVHMRRPFRFFAENGVHAWLFQVIVGGKVMSMIINPLLWLTTVSYFALNALVGPEIESLFPPAVYYIAVVSLVFGNFLYIYYYMIGCARRRQWPLMKYVFLVPFYWLLVSLAAAKAAYQLAVKPHFWEKTRHGLHLRPPRPARPVPAWPRLLPAEKPAFFSAIMPLVRTRRAVLAVAANWQERAARVWRAAQSARRHFALVRARLVPASVRQSFLSGLRSQEGFFLLASLAASFLNLAFNAYAGRVLSFEDLSLVVFVNTVWFFASIIIASYSLAVSHYSAYYAGASEPAAGLRFASGMKRLGLKIALPAALAWTLFTPALSVFFNIGDRFALLSLAPVFVIGVVLYANTGFFKGVGRWRLAGVILFVEAVFKIAVLSALVVSGNRSLAYLVVPMSIVLSGAISVFAFGAKPGRRPGPVAGAFRFPWKFFYPSLMANIATLSFLSFDIILAKHFFSPRQAGEYALLSLIGKMIYFGGSLPNQFMMPAVSRREGGRQDSNKVFERIFLATLVIVIAGEIALGVFGRYTAAWIFGGKISEVSRYFLVYATAIGLFTLSNVIVTYHLAKKRYIFAKLSLAFSLLMAALMAVSHSSIGEFAQAMFYAGLAGFVTLGLAHLYRRRLAVYKDKLLSALEQAPAPAGGFGGAETAVKRVLILNWRDLRHVFAGGAELYIHEIARRWAKQGIKVTVFCGNDRKSPRNETIDGVEIIRRGGFYLVYAWAFFYYIFKFRSRYDAIIDCENGIPFYAPLYAREPVYCLVHHMHQDVFRKSLPKPLAALASFLEKDLMPLVYRDCRFITVSESSREEMVRYGLGRAGITVVSPGADLESLSLGEKHHAPLVAYLGRLKAYKSIHHLLFAFKKVAGHLPEARLLIAGSGEEEGRLRTLAQDLGLSRQVLFAGRVSEAQKAVLLQKAWLMVNPSYMEGWGITTIEANAAGTPVVASDVPGLRDSVVNNETGLLFKYGQTRELSDKILYLLKNHPIREKLGRQAYAWAQRHDWQMASLRVYSVLDNGARRPADGGIIWPRLAAAEASSHEE